MSDQEEEVKDPNEIIEEAEETTTAPEKIEVTINQEELDQLRQEAKEYKDKYLRLLAEQENMRKRQQKEKIEQLRFANEGLMVDFLKPMDNLENALNFAKDMSDEVKNWAIGFQMILTQFKDVLSLNGVTPFESKGELFDPHIHEAVEMVETDDHPAGCVVEQCSRGYKMGDRVIRPARVKVSKSLTEEKEEKETDNNNESLI